MANKFNIDQYTPANPPMDGPGVSRATWDEFYRLSSVIAGILNPAGLSILSAVSVSVTSTDSYKTLFDSTGTESYNWQQPTDQLGIDGAWWCPESGVYKITLDIRVPINTDPMWNEPVSLGKVKLTTNTVEEVFEFEEVSSLPPFMQVNLLRPYSLGDVVEFELDLTRGTESGSETVNSTLNILKVGAIK
jgi:hypothetical protein